MPDANPKNPANKYNSLNSCKSYNFYIQYLVYIHLLSKLNEGGGKGRFMNQMVTLKEVREQLSELVARVAYGDQKVVITRFGKPLVAIVNYEDYEKLINPAGRFTDKEWEKGFEFVAKAREASKDVSDKEAQKIIDRETSAVRSAKNVTSRS